MNRTLKWAVGVSVSVASMLAVAGNVIAQEVILLEDLDGLTQPRPQVDSALFPYAADTVSELLIDDFYTNDQNYYDNRSIARQVQWFFGLSHTENEINRDGDVFSEFIQDAWNEQWSSSDTIRTRDLPNPYQSSLLLEPNIPEQEFPPTSIRQPIAAPPVATPREVRDIPVRALW